jgi:hypothetical protein
MKKEQGNWVAESKQDFDGWEIVGIRDFKPGVKIVAIRSSHTPPAEFRAVYTSDEHVPEFKPKPVCKECGRSFG